MEKTPGPGGLPSNWLKTLRDDLAVFDPPKAPRKTPHVSLELKSYCGPMQQAGGQFVPGRAVRFMVRWHEVGVGKNRAQSAVQPGCIAPESEGVGKPG